MDPMTNPTPNPNPAPAPGPNPAPVVPPAPVPAQPATPTAPVTPTNSTAQPPVNPVINPTNPNPVNPVFQPSNPNGVAATEPILRPEPAPAPDPVEEELKAPMKAAGPVPGSIGSAVSGPEVAEEPVTESVAPVMSDSPAAPVTPTTENPFAEAPKNSTPSVSFNDPATQPDATNPVADSAKPAKKKNNKMTLIILVVVAVMVVIALAAVLIFQLMGESNSGSTSQNNNSGNSSQTSNSGSANGGSSTSGGNGEVVDNGAGGTVSSVDTIVCTATQASKDALTSEIGQTVSNATMTLNFVGDKFTGISVEIVAASDSGVDTTSASEYTVSQFLTQAGMSQEELEAQGAQFDADGNMIISRDQMMSAITEDGIDGYTCVGPSQS